MLTARAGVAPGERIIDVGCGCGGTTRELALRVGADGRAIGVDVSAPMIARARERAGAASAAEFIVADAAAHEFAPGWADLLFSRFGVMFFADPALAFANLRKGLTRGGRVVFACWREIERNPWQTIALGAACKHVPRPPEIGPDDPGPFSFADEARVRRILGTAGFGQIALTPVDLELDLAAGGGLEAAVAALQQIGAAARALEGQPDDRRAAALAAIRAALAPHQRGMSLPLGAAIWIVEAVNP
jgi:SAM-dependent methyltransferase